MLPQKKPQFQLVMDSFSLDFVIVRLICLQAADLQDVSAVSGVSYTCTLIICVLSFVLLLSQV